MSTVKKSRSDVTAAEDKVIGFDYQYYYFLYLLLNIDKGEVIGLEVKEDVHIDKPDGITILAQLKHTIDPKETNLTELDSDLWKTLYNWAELVIESGENELDDANKKKKQLDFCKNVNFVLVTNKPLGPRNNFVKELGKFQAGISEFKDFLFYLNTIKTESVDLGEYIKIVKSLESEVLSEFLLKISIEVGVDDLRSKIIMRLRKMMIPAGKADNLLKVLDGALRKANYEKVKEKEKFMMSFEQFHKQYEIYFQIARSEELVIENYSCNIDNPENQIFIKQLMDIEDLLDGEDDMVVQYTTYKLMAFNNLAQWLQQGLITENHFTGFDKEAIGRWENVFRRAYRTIRGRPDSPEPSVAIPPDIREIARKCLDDVRDMELAIRGQQLGVLLSNGHFYSLSDSLKIGWSFDWKTRYGTAK